MGMTVQSAKQMVSLQLQKYKHHNILDVIPNIFATTPRFMEIGHVNEYRDPTMHYFWKSLTHLVYDSINDID